MSHAHSAVVEAFKLFCTKHSVNDIKEGFVKANKHSNVAQQHAAFQTSASATYNGLTGTFYPGEVLAYRKNDTFYPAVLVSKSADIHRIVYCKDNKTFVRDVTDITLIGKLTKRDFGSSMEPARKIITCCKDEGFTIINSTIQSFAGFFASAGYKADTVFNFFVDSYPMDELIIEDDEPPSASPSVGKAPRKALSAKKAPVKRTRKAPVKKAEESPAAPVAAPAAPASPVAAPAAPAAKKQRKPRKSPAKPAAPVSQSDEESQAVPAAKKTRKPRKSSAKQAAPVSPTWSDDDESQVAAPAAKKARKSSAKTPADKPAKNGRARVMAAIPLGAADSDVSDEEYGICTDLIRELSQIDQDEQFSQDSDKSSKSL